MHWQDPATVAKNEGNAQFKSGNYEEAITSYKKALGLARDKEIDIIHKNIAACYLKLVSQTCC